MEVTVNTRISELIKANKDSIAAIASLAKPLEKLQNPILRKLMASRVTIGEAAKMGGCTVHDFQRVLVPLGFNFVSDDLVGDLTHEELPEWLKLLPENQIIIFDVREILSGGQDPLKQILKRFKETPTGKALCIVNTFVPVPLVRLLEKDGVLSYTKKVQPNEYHTYFYKVPDSQPASETTNTGGNEKLRMLNHDEFQREYKRYSKEQIREIDVRHLEMPGPMQTILEILPQLGSDEALYVNHKRVPLYLLEEIADEDYDVSIWTQSDTDVKLLIARTSG